MKILVERDDLLSAISAASRSSSVNSTVPILEGLLFQALDSTLTVTGYDMKTGIRVKIDAEVRDPGTIVLRAKLINDVVRSMPGGPVTIDVTADSLVRVSCFNSKFELMGNPADDFPELPGVDELSSVSIPQGKLKKLITETMFSISDNETRPVLTGSKFEIAGNRLTVVAVDGYRLALRREDFTSSNSDSTSFIVPGNALHEIARLSAGDEDEAHVTIGTRHLLFKIGPVEIISRRLDGEFLDYEKSLPLNTRLIFTADRKAVLESAERVSLILDDKAKYPLKCEITGDVLNFRAETGFGRANDECLIEMQNPGEEILIGFNYKFVTEALKNCPAQTIRVALNGPTNPCVITPAEDGDDSFLYMILPVRIRAE
jgi:DNA polymerase-3 subunit beta